MRYINKTLRKTDGNSLIDEFLSSNWDSSNTRYNMIQYKDNWNFRNTLRPNLKQLLLEEQMYLCCYCMRKLTDNNTTFEHVVPRSTDTQEILNKYNHHDIISNNICLQSVFAESNVQLNTPPYPLEIAYENLTASCDRKFNNGSTTYPICNHQRKDKLIEPLFYIPTIENDISYYKEGTIECNETLKNSILILNLNFESLKDIRKVWYHISIEDFTSIENANTEFKRQSILISNLMDLSPNVREKLIRNFKTEVFWNILMEYDWFYEYYRNVYPTQNR